MRDQFEKLPEIAEGLQHCTYNESTNDYHANVAHDNEWEWHTQFVNGAWYAYQEQQKKLNCCREENKAHLEKIDGAWNELDDRNSKEYIIENLEKILKGNKDGRV